MKILMPDTLAEGRKQALSPAIAPVNSDGQRTARALNLQRRLGKVVALMAFSSSHKHLFPTDLKWAVFSPLKLCRYRTRQGQNKQVAAYESWAWVNKKTAARLRSVSGTFSLL